MVVRGWVAADGVGVDVDDGVLVGELGGVTDPVISTVGTVVDAVSGSGVAVA
jgi:hypothetical protein